MTTSSRANHKERHRQSLLWIALLLVAGCVTLKCGTSSRSPSAPDSPVLRGPMWQEQALQGDYRTTIDRVEQALRNPRRPPDDEMLRWLLACYFKNGDWHKAAVFIQTLRDRASWKEPGAHPEARALVELWKIRNGRFNELVDSQLADKSVGLEWGVRALALGLRNRRGEAQRAVDSALLHSQQGLSRLFLGDWYQIDSYLKRHAGDLRGASQSSAQARQLLPASQAALRGGLELQSSLLRNAGSRAWNRVARWPAESIPIDTDAGRILLTTRINSTRSRLLLDTGATLSILFPGLSPPRLDTIIEQWPVSTLSGLRFARIGWAREVRVEDWQLEGVPFALLPEGISGSDHHGILGTSAFFDCRLEIDLVEQLLRVDRGAADSAAGIPIYFVGDKLFVLAQLEDQWLRLQLDTGWNASALALFRLGSPPTLNLKFGQERLVDLSVQTIPRPSTPTEAHQIFGVIEFDGLLGLPALAGRVFRLDLAGGRLELQRVRFARKD